MNDQYDLEELKRSCDAAILLARSAGGMNISGVDGGHVSCIHARHWVDADGKSGHTVLVSEADPIHPHFYQFITGKLLEAGFSNVNVATGW